MDTESQDSLTAQLRQHERNITSAQDSLGDIMESLNHDSGRHDKQILHMQAAALLTHLEHELRMFCRGSTWMLDQNPANSFPDAVAMRTAGHWTAGQLEREMRHAERAEERIGSLREDLRQRRESDGVDLPEHIV
jgi:hypothetical protein